MSSSPLQRKTSSNIAGLEFGLKLWSSNTQWFEEAVELCRSNIFQFIELAIIPGTDLEAITSLNRVPVKIHAPHENFGFNIFSLTEREIKRFATEVIKAADLFNSPTIVVHAGVGQDRHFFQQQLERLGDQRIIIENMPIEGLDGGRCFGATIDELSFITGACKRSLCIDVGHATKSALSQRLDPKAFLTDVFSTFRPRYIHLSDGSLKNFKDEHLNLGRGNYDLPWIKTLLETAARETKIAVVLEVPKNNSDLANDVNDLQYFLNLAIRQ